MANWNVHLGSTRTRKKRRPARLPAFVSTHVSPTRFVRLSEQRRPFRSAAARLRRRRRPRGRHGRGRRGVESSPDRRLRPHRHRVRVRQRQQRSERRVVRRLDVVVRRERDDRLGGRVSGEDDVAGRREPHDSERVARRDGRHLSAGEDARADRVAVHEGDGRRTDVRFVQRLGPCANRRQGGRKNYRRCSSRHGMFFFDRVQG